MKVHQKSVGEHQSQVEGCRGRFWKLSEAKQWELLISVLGISVLTLQPALALHLPV